MQSYNLFNPNQPPQTPSTTQPATQTPSNTVSSSSFNSSMALEAPVSVLPPAIINLNAAAVSQPSSVNVPVGIDPTTITAPGSSVPGVGPNPSSNPGGVTPPTASNPNQPVVPPLSGPVTGVTPPTSSTDPGVNPLSWIPLNGRCEWFDDGKDTKGCEPNAQDLQRKADELEANIKKSTGLSAQERAALEFELVKTLAWRVDLLNPGGTGPSARASIWAVVESPAYRNLSPERKLALWQVVSTGLQTGKLGRDDLGRVAGGMWG
jgi:hypothetical protein